MKGHFFLRCGTCKSGVHLPKHRAGCHGTRATWTFVVWTRRPDGGWKQVWGCGYATREDAEQGCANLLNNRPGGALSTRDKVAAFDRLMAASPEDIARAAS